jgi:SAM-dependent methyltransferase
MVENNDHHLVCANPECRTTFPVIDGIPVLINELRSIFSIDDFLARRDTTFAERSGQLERIARWFERAIPSISLSVGGRRNYRRLGDCLFQRTPHPKVLVLGGSILGGGMDELAADPSIEFVATDVSFGPLTALICDAHDIPFADESFDGVIVQAVLEHVVDPYRCVAEIHRVLKSKGLVYAETPFMQQVHMGPYDFTRFTHSGHRRLFRHFDEIASGPIGGPGMALAWSYEHFLLSFTSYRPLRAFIRAFAGFTSFYLKYFDYYLVQKGVALDAASGFHFFGRKADHVLPDRQLIAYYEAVRSRPRS